MRNTGEVFANDANAERTKALMANIHRLGVRNAVVTNLDGRMFPKVHLSLSLSSPDLESSY